MKTDEYIELESFQILIRTGDRLKVTEPDGSSRIFKFAGVIVGIEEGESVRLISEDGMIHDMSFAGFNRKKIEFASSGGNRDERNS